MISPTSSGTFSTSRVRRRSDSGETTPVVDPLPTEDTERGRPTRETGAGINEQDKGDVHAKDRTATGSDPVSVAIELAAEDRMAIAREIGEASKLAVSSFGSVRLATALQLLRRALSKAHSVLGDRKSEADFLSIVVIAETAISGKKWSELARDVFQCIGEAAAVGATQDRVSYDDFNRVFRRLNATGSVSGPVLDFDGTDGEHGEAQAEDVLR